MDRSFSNLPLRRIERQPDAAPADTQWPATVPAVAQLLRDGLDLGPLTVLVGENGSGKSTLVEAVAGAFGISVEGGSVAAQNVTRPTESDLASLLHLVRGASASRWGFFLRAETMHGFYTYLEREATDLRPPGRAEPVFHEMSHGESFLAVLSSRFTGSGLYLLDEPESALSFTHCLGLVGVLTDLAHDSGAQVVVATHSPVVAALPGATLLELDQDGYHETTWDQLELVGHHRAFLDAPQRYLRHL